VGHTAGARAQGGSPRAFVF